jgi:hypothetical protein
MFFLVLILKIKICNLRLINMYSRLKIVFASDYNSYLGVTDSCLCHLTPRAFNHSHTYYLEINTWLLLAIMRQWPKDVHNDLRVAGPKDIMDLSMLLYNSQQQLSITHARHTA